MTLTSRDYDGQSDDNGERAVFIVNGTAVGRGREGFKDVLRRLQELPTGSTVSMFWDERIKGPSRRHYMPPFRLEYYGELSDEFDRIWVERRLVEGGR